LFAVKRCNIRYSRSAQIFIGAARGGLKQNRPPGGQKAELFLLAADCAITE
jgi:hypothetical protein